MNSPILVDCDGVLSNVVDSFLNLAATKFNVFKKREDVTSTNIGAAIGCPALDYLVDEEVLHGELCYRMKPIAEGLLFFRTLEATYGSENVFVATVPWAGDSRERATGEWSSQRYAWLRDHLGVRRNRVYMAGNKDHIQGILIDDCESNLKNRAEGQAYCIATPYNTEYGGPRGDYGQCLEWLKENIK